MGYIFYTLRTCILCPVLIDNYNAIDTKKVEVLFLLHKISNTQKLNGKLFLGSTAYLYLLRCINLNALSTIVAQNNKKDM